MIDLAVAFPVCRWPLPWLVILAGVVLGLVYALGWWRGWAGRTDTEPDLMRLMRRRVAELDAVSVESLTRAVEAEKDAERYRGWLMHIRYVRGGGDGGLLSMLQDALNGQAAPK